MPSDFSILSVVQYLILVFSSELLNKNIHTMSSEQDVGIDKMGKINLAFGR